MSEYDDLKAAVVALAKLCDEHSGKRLSAWRLISHSATVKLPVEKGEGEGEP